MEIRYKVTHQGKDTGQWLERLSKKDYFKVLDSCAKAGVAALSSNTPVRTGKSAASWTYKIERGATTTTIGWYNSNVTRDGEPIVILLQMGHGTGTGGYVVGRDFINPAMKPVFDDIENKVWKVVTADG